MPGPKETIVLRPPKSLWVVMLLTTLVFVAFAIGSFMLELEGWYRAVLVVLACLCPVGWAELAIQRVELEGDEMAVVNNFRRRTFSSREILKVTWAKGMGTAIQLADETWVQLPPVGSSPQGVTNTIRAWRKRTSPPKG